MKKRKTLCVIIVVLLIFTFVSVSSPDFSYSESENLNISHWAIEDVEAALFYGLVPSELLEGSLKIAITREEFASLIVRVWEKETNTKISIDESNPFDDTNNESVLKAFQLGIVNGIGNGEYAPEDKLSREAASTMLTRLYLKLAKEDIAIIKTQPFKDDDNIHGWAKEAVYYMAGKDILKGVGANEFKPLEPITKEQSLVISLRMLRDIFRNSLGYLPETSYTPGEKVWSLADVESAFTYAQYHLIPEISLTMDSSLNAALLESLNVEDSGVFRKLEIADGSTFSYNPKTKKYIAYLKYSLMAEVSAIILNERIDMSRTSHQAQEIQSQLLMIIKELISSDMDYYQREKAIHDYIVKNNYYDLGKQGGLVSEESYSLKGLLENGKGVCQGYAQFFTALCLSTKIPSRIVYGEAGGGRHAWNMVELYGKCYHVDVTWNDPIPDRGSKIGYTYYNVPESFIKKDHQWNFEDYPFCDFVTYED